MTQDPNAHTQVIGGTLRNVRLKNTTAEVFFRAGDREGMAATGVAAAALGLSGAAAGMVTMSMEEMSEPVSQVSFDLDGKHVEALLWNWPFKDGDEVQAVVEPAPDGGYTGFAVLDPKEKIIVLYPHVSAGVRAHWKNVFKFSFFAGAAFALFMISAAILGGRLASFSNANSSLSFYLLAFLMFVSMFLWIGYRMGRRFTPFILMAEPIFTVLGWKDVKNINLRKTTKAKKKPTDPPAMGDSYFRY
ncbi:putative type VI secretion system effector [Xanthomonas fragariae]|uniref:ISXo2 transposase n=1 Tax=Xanthomonas fragariae TaxID=48664 RepID=A0A1Y6HMI9_9XANT|nr:putative type VI secretion system effector [Xanthomonas fragariae]AOD15800.1 hypothetical protein BER92_15175 [Xanthomonas fragariae]AOD19215.1 hypothetical protein BER93_15210 [Xanthomonas fragariae]MBL9196898.1 hypothetical protein [Xanthomonas fragariae]MBL9221205.1 hypothetical protein [Xanthomonas fragariae]MDM7572880.1 putative type VI secretion system effector [Xanthomonas fragariae]